MLVDNFLNAIISEGKSKNTIEAYTKDIKEFEEYFNKTKNIFLDLQNIKKITRFDLDDYFRDLGEKLINAKLLSNSTRARKLSIIKSFFKYLVDTRIIREEENVSERIKPPKKSKKLPIYLSIDESKKLIKNITDITNKTLIVFLLSTGLRISELINIDIEHIKKDFSMTITGKGDKERRILLNSLCEEQLKEYIKERNKRVNEGELALFVSNKGSRMSISNAQTHIKNEIKKILKRSDVSAHKLRHSFATMQLKSGVDIKTLQKQMGHSDISTTILYTHVDQDQTDEAFRKNPLSANR